MPPAKFYGALESAWIPPCVVPCILQGLAILLCKVRLQGVVNAEWSLYAHLKPLSGIVFATHCPSTHRYGHYSCAHSACWKAINNANTPQTWHACRPGSAQEEAFALISQWQQPIHSLVLAAQRHVYLLSTKAVLVSCWRSSEQKWSCTANEIDSYFVVVLSHIKYKLESGHCLKILSYCLCNTLILLYLIYATLIISRMLITHGYFKVQGVRII